MSDLRYVFSAPAMLRLNKSTWETANSDEFAQVKAMTIEGMQRLRADIKHKVHGSDFGIDILFNAYTEKDMGERISENDNFGFEKLYADSGGLQIVTAGKSVDDSLKANIYGIQSHADFAMCFDEIPCGNKAGMIVDSKSNRSNTGNKVYFPGRKTETATKTANNIREQIETLDKFGTNTVVHYIIQGNTYEDMVEWFDDGTKVLTEDHFKRVGGLALADTCMGNGPLESIDMLVAYHLIHKQFGVERIKTHVHLLGLGSVRRLLPVLYLMKSGFLPNDLTISFDSTTFSMSYFMGRFTGSNGQKVQQGEANYKAMFHDVYKYFGDIYHKYVPACEEGVFVDHVVKEIRSLADSINNAHDVIAPVVRANITLTLCWQILGFIENINKAIDHSKHDNSPMGRLQHVKNMDDYMEWKAQFGNRVASSRITREGATLDAFWE